MGQLDMPENLQRTFHFIVAVRISNSAKEGCLCGSIAVKPERVFSVLVYIFLSYIVLIASSTPSIAIAHPCVQLKRRIHVVVGLTVLFKRRPKSCQK